MALWTPLALGASLRAAFEGDTLSVGNGNPVASWVDQTSHAYTLVQATAANKPTLVTNDLATHSTVSFDGSNDRLTIASGLGITAQPLSIFAVWSMANTNQQALTHFHNDGSNDPFTGIEAGSALQGSVMTAVTVAITKGTWRMTSTVLNGASSALAIDGGTRTTGNVGAGSPAGDKLVVGSLQDESGWFLSGKIAALMVLSSAVTQAQEDQLFGWAAWKYGLTANLPGGHPYKSAAPTAAGGHTGLRYRLCLCPRQRALGSRHN